MKNSTRLLYFGVLVLLLLPLTLLAQEATAQAGVGFFSKIGGWVKDNLAVMFVTFMGGIFTQRGWTHKIKLTAHKGAIVLKDFGELLTHTGNVLQQVDDAIHDDDTIDAKGILDAVSQGKNIYVEGKEVIISIKPKTP